MVSSHRIAIAVADTLYIGGAHTNNLFTYMVWLPLPRQVLFLLHNPKSWRHAVSENKSVPRRLPVKDLCNFSHAYSEVQIKSSKICFWYMTAFRNTQPLFLFALRLPGKVINPSVPNPTIDILCKVLHRLGIGGTDLIFIYKIRTSLYFLNFNYLHSVGVAEWYNRNVSNESE